MGDAPPAVRSLDSGAQELIHLAVAEEDEMDTVEQTTDAVDTPPTSIPPPPGFSSVGDGQSLFTFTKDLPGWFPDNSGGLPVDMPKTAGDVVVAHILSTAITY